MGASASPPDATSGDSYDPPELPENVNLDVPNESYTGSERSSREFPETRPAFRLGDS